MLIHFMQRKSIHDYSRTYISSLHCLSTKVTKILIAPNKNFQCHLWSTSPPPKIDSSLNDLAHFAQRKSIHRRHIFSISPLTKVTKIPRFIYPKYSKYWKNLNLLIAPKQKFPIPFMTHPPSHLSKNRFVLERFGPLRSKKVSTGRRAHAYALTHRHASFATFLFPLQASIEFFLCLPVRGSLINFSRSSQPRPEWLGERRERHHAFSQDLFGPWAGNEANSRGRESLARTSNPINIVATRAAGGFSDSLPPILERIHHSTRLSNNLQRPGPFSRVWKILQYRRHQSHTRLYICAQQRIKRLRASRFDIFFPLPPPQARLTTTWFNLPR